MDRVLLRKLAWKSKLGFGKFADLTIHDIMIVEPYYLAWVFYQFEMIDFIDEIKEQLQLIPIAKPGAEPDKLREWKITQSEQYTDEERMHNRMIRARKRKAQKVACLMAAKKLERFSARKSVLQAKNHGHF